MSAPVHRDAGFSLVELLLAVTLLGMLLSSVALVGRTSERAFRRGATSSALEQRASLALAALLQELERAILASLAPDPTPGLGASALRYLHALDINGVDLELSTQRSLRLELAPNEVDNGVDDDGDGLSDEALLILISDLGLVTERRRVLAHDVAELLEGELPNGADDNGNGLVDEPGFVVERRGDTLELAITFIGATADGTESMRRTVRSSVMLRN